MDHHCVTTQVPVDSSIGEEMVIFRSSRFPFKHNDVREGCRITLEKRNKVLAAGIVTNDPLVCLFRDISDRDIEDGYFAAARTRESLLQCLKEMYPDSGYNEYVPTVLIRLKRTE